MTALEVVFRYGLSPGSQQMRAIDGVREVYGIRRIKFDDKGRTVRVEYDATRLDADDVAGLLRGAGLDLRERVALV
jgi:hypothetical protein